MIIVSSTEISDSGNNWHNEWWCMSNYVLLLNYLHACELHSVTCFWPFTSTAISCIWRAVSGEAVLSSKEYWIWVISHTILFNLLPRFVIYSFLVKTSKGCYNTVAVLSSEEYKQFSVTHAHFIIFSLLHPVCGSFFSQKSDNPSSLCSCWHWQ